MVGQKIIYCCGTFMVSPSSRQLDYFELEEHVELTGR